MRFLFVEYVCGFHRRGFFLWSASDKLHARVFFLLNASDKLNAHISFLSNVSVDSTDEVSFCRARLWVFFCTLRER